MKGVKDENQIPLRSMNQLEDATSVGTLNISKNRKLSNAVRITAIVITVALVLVLMSYFIYSKLMNGDIQEVIQENVKSGRGLSPPNPHVPLPPSWSPLHAFESAGICSDSQMCSNIAKNIFLKGGNAVDATLSTLFCNGLTTMQSLGIGGGMIMNVFIRSENRAYTIDAREVAPFRSTESMFEGLPREASFIGGLSIAVPGELMGYHEAHQRFGSMTWKDILEPSIKICEDGIEISEHMGGSFKMNTRIKENINLRKMFVNETTNGFYRIGTRVSLPKALCDSYKLISENGPIDFYNGTLSKLVIKDLEELGSIITQADLETYRADLVSSLTLDIDQHVLHLVPPIGSGTIVGAVMNILSTYNFTKASISNETNAALTYHRIAEALKFGFAKRWELGDMRFNDVRQLISDITSKNFATDVHSKIDDNHTYNDPASYGAHFSFNKEHGTSHTSVIAPNGDAVSVTSSINYYFGSGLMGNRSGIIFNSGMDDFARSDIKANYNNLPPAPSNTIEPQKRPQSSMSPTIITDQTGNVELVIGAAGGSKIISAIVWVIARVLWFGEDIKTAIDSPRIHHQLSPNVLEYEYGILENIVEILESKGHKTSRLTGRGSVVCGISKNSTAIYLTADFMKKGGVAGF